MAVEEKLDGLRDRLVRPEGLEVPDHGARDRHAVEYRAHLHEGGLLAGAEKDEERDQDEHRVSEHAQDPEEERDSLPHVGGDARGPDVVEPHGQERPEHAPAVHRKRGDQIEGRHDHVEHEELRDEAPLVDQGVREVIDP